MSFDEATIMAYVDGECDAVTVNRIEKAMETDPALARQIEQAQALRDKLSAHYDPVTEEAVPDRLAAMLTASAVSPHAKSNRTKASNGAAAWVLPNGAQ